MDYITSLIFGQALAKTGSPLKAVVIVGLLLLLGVLAYGTKAAIDAAISASRKKQERLDAEAAARNIERQQLTAAVEAAHAKMTDFMERHLANEAKVLAAVDANLRILAEDMKAHRQEESARATNLHVKLEDIHRSVISKGASA